MVPLFWLLDTAFTIARWLFIGVVVVSWLVHFGIMNGSNPTVRQIRYALYRLTEPVLGPIRRALPDLGGIDISPIVALIGIEFLRVLVFTYLPPLLM